MKNPASSMILTVRATSEVRKRNLYHVLGWYLKMQGWEVIVVEQDHAPQLDSTDWPYTVKRLFVKNSGPFNKGWGLNVGAKAANSDVLFFCDSDLLLAHSALKAASNLCHRALAVKPYDKLIDLNEFESEAILTTHAEPNFERSDASKVRGNRENLCFCGGAFFMHQSLFSVLGGFDERYLGWGAEDDAMTLKMHRMTDQLAALENRAAVHLWHERSVQSTFGNAHYPDNLKMLKDCAALPGESLRFLCDLQRQLMGNPGKYEHANINTVT
jgi:predicted glycosyltransferase involved in capsule biosynthesis